ncbi:hypothetical protein EZV77_09290 [Burkholderia thailandensis]|nr:hypothetical protein BTL_4839 [Burkholderia thailandensis H0587]AJY32197.1 hypothetical protein BTM_4738 [Burkholderia thailandensis 34]AVR29413.1 hypothetical protein A8H32_19525 [Burkholderia thailandensis]PJO70882.1 hypothetical protein CWD92_18865 [Burkholderia thailandensis]PNE79151.1 hypothetical protein A8H37_05635 [Burkholderia thailandensis]
MVQLFDSPGFIERAAGTPHERVRAACARERRPAPGGASERRRGAARGMRPEALHGREPRIACARRISRAPHRLPKKLTVEPPPDRSGASA